MSYDIGSTKHSAALHPSLPRCLSSSAVQAGSGMELPEEKKMNEIISWWACNCASLDPPRQHVAFQEPAEPSWIL